MLDPETFLNFGVDGELPETFVPVDVDPEGYEAMIVDIKPRIFQDRNGEYRTVLDIWWKITDPVKGPVQAQKTGMREPRVRQSIFLDVEYGPPDEDGVPTIAGIMKGPGKNVALGQLRAVLGQNKPGKRWSFQELLGGVARVLVEHVTGEDGVVFAQVRRKQGVVPLS
jgi:hypothetical protein